MSVVRPIVVISLLGIVAGGGLPGCGQKGPLVQPDAAPKHRKISTPKLPLKAPATPAGNTPEDVPPPAPAASPAPTDPQQ